MSREPTAPQGFSRRTFLKGVSAAAVSPSLLPVSAVSKDPAGRVLGPGPVPLSLTINGRRVQAMVEPRATLLDLLRNQLELTGAKEACDLGACGACTLEVGGKTVNACMVLALDCEGAEILTVEGLSDGEKLHPLQQSFVEADALQCGYCTCGMLMSAHACLAANPGAGSREIREALAGNLCRCGTYPRVFEACEKAAHTMLRDAGARKGGKR